MADLSERQIQILKAVVQEYIETAEPVGSETLDKKYNLGVSPATIRGEMVKLTKAGYLRQSHTSSGRTPTSIALKYYVKNLMKPQELSVAEEVAMKGKIWDYRAEFDRLLRETTKALAQKTKTLSLVTTDEGEIYYSGTANILEMPEFFDIDLTKSVFSFLDRFDFWENLVERAISEEDPIHLLLGNELGEYLSACGFIYTHYQAGPRHGAIGVVGPVRLNYPVIMPVVGYFGRLINEISKSW